MEIEVLCQIISKDFDMFEVAAKVSPKSLKEDDQDSVKKARRLPVERP